MQGEDVINSAKGRTVITAGHVVMVLIVIGVALRIASLVNRDVGFDANYYLTMGQSFVRHGEFYMPWGDPSDLNGIPSYSHHISPLFPAYLGAFYAGMGMSYTVAQAACLVISLIALAAVYWATKNLYGWQGALIATAIFALDYELIVETGKLYSENMTFLFFTLTMWAIVRGVKDDRYIVLAGLFAGLAYLVRSSLGYFFIVAGVGGFLWRFYYMRWRVFRNKWYLAGIAVFLGIVGGWALRNLYRFGWPNWETSAAIQATVINALGRPIEYVVVIVLLIPFFVLILMTYGAYWLPELRASVRKIKDEQVSGLWLAVFLVPFIALFISGALSLGETQKGVPLFWRDRVRYIFYAFLPLVWLGIRSVDFSLTRPVGESAKGILGSVGRLKGRIAEIVRNRLWLSAFIVVLAGAVVSLLTMGGWLAAFLFMAIPALPLKSPRKRFTIFLAVLLVFAVEAGTGEVKFAAPKAGIEVNSLLASGEVVAVDGTTYHHLYFLYPFLDDPENQIVTYNNNPNAPYILSYNVTRAYPGYYRIGNFSDESHGGLISEFLARITGHTTYSAKLSIVLWRHV